MHCQSHTKSHYVLADFDIMLNIWYRIIGQGDWTAVIMKTTSTILQKNLPTLALPTQLIRPEEFCGRENKKAQNSKDWPLTVTFYTFLIFNTLFSICSAIVTCSVFPSYIHGNFFPVRLNLDCFFYSRHTQKLLSK